MNKQRIIFRVDASPHIGLGHITRCIALAHMLKNNFEITFVCKEIPAKLIQELHKNNFGFEKIEDENEFLNKLKSDDIVVLDGYDFDSEYQKKIKQVGCKLVCIDDLHNQEFVADLIINHSPGITAKDYQAQSFTQFALGPQYALLRPAFLEQAKRGSTIGKTETVLISFGGSDNKNLTESTLNAVLSFKEFKKIIVVTGSFYQYSESLNKLVESDNRIEHHCAVDEKKMLSLMTEADVAIVPASGMLYEVLATGCKVISGMYVENQKLAFKQFKSLNAFESAEGFEIDDLKLAIENTLKNPNKVSKQIDGKSAKNVLLKFLELTTEIRRVKESDCQLLFDWANEIENRQNSISTKPILWDEHLKWFNSKINSEDSKLFILEFKNRPIGQIRFDKMEDYWAIDYSIDYAYRGNGFGKIILSKSLNLLDSDTLQATVKNKNNASINVFLSHNFKQISSEIINNHSYFTYQLQI